MIRYISWLKSAYDYGYNDTVELWAGLPCAVLGKDNLLYNSLSTDAPSRFFWVMGVTYTGYIWNSFLHQIVLRFSAKFRSRLSRYQIVTRDIPSRGIAILLVTSRWKCGIFSSRSYVMHLMLNFFFKPVTSFFIYFKNFCARASCKNDGTCQSGFTRKRYRCLCAPGFTGHDCEIGNT